MEYKQADETVGSAIPLENGNNTKTLRNKQIEVEGLSFGEALKALKDFKRVTCTAWWEDGIFIFLQVPSSVNMKIVPKMTSLPTSVKAEFLRRHTAVSIEHKEDMDIRYRNQIAVVYPDCSIYSWTPCTHDILQDDWIILK